VNCVISKSGAQYDEENERVMITCSYIRIEFLRNLYNLCMHPAVMSAAPRMQILQKDEGGVW
jgi:predicted nuclease of restriction endonuclease-like RecB superfamily